LSDSDKSPEIKKDLMRKYAHGLGEIWKGMIDNGPEEGDPLELFAPAIEVTEKSLASILAD
jgi:hypothetical protein